MNAGAGLLVIGSEAPLFEARCTFGRCTLESYRGSWLVFSSHPADFTSVCTSELIAFAKAHDTFRSKNCELLCLSVDSLFSHFAWVRAIEADFSVRITFPIIEDVSMVIAAAYQMIDPSAADTSTVSATYIIDPAGIIRATIHYPMEIGRSVSEIMRVLQALQTSDEHNVSIPEGWQPGDKVIQVATVANGLANQGSDVDPKGSSSWYYRLREL